MDKLETQICFVGVLIGKDKRIGAQSSLKLLNKHDFLIEMSKAVKSCKLLKLEGQLFIFQTYF